MSLKETGPAHHRKKNPTPVQKRKRGEEEEEEERKMRNKRRKRIKELRGEAHDGIGGEGMLRMCHNYHAVWYTTVIYKITFNADFKPEYNNTQ